MNTKMKFIALALLAVSYYACEEAKLDREVEVGLELEKPVGVVFDEIVNRLDVLKEYADGIQIGANASLGNITGNNMSTLITTNFTQVTPSTELNSNALLMNDGSYDFTAINNYIDAATERGLSVYGDAIVSNINQKDSLLNTIGASLTYLTPLYPNFIDQGVLDDGTFTDWSMQGDISVEDYMGQSAIKVVNGAAVGNSDDTYLQSPVYAVEDGAKFELTFYMLSTQEGEGRVVFNGLNNNEPEKDWTGNGTPSATFKTQIGWNKIQVQTTDFDGSGNFSFKIELGYTQNVTHYINVQGISLINLNGSVDNIDEIFVEAEDGEIGPEWQVNSDSNASNETFVLANSAANYLTPNDPGSEPYIINYPINVNKAGTYTCWVRGWGPSGNDDSFFLSVNGSSFSFGWWPLGSSSWSWVNIGTYSLTRGENVFAACIRENGYKMDRFYFTLTSNVPSGTGAAAISQTEVTLLVSDDVKKLAVENALKKHIEIVLSNLGEKINAWTVVKTPLAEDGSIAGSGGTSLEGEYFWADYIGDDYVLQAFETARNTAPAQTMLFISETDLDINSSKRESLINMLTNNSNIDGVAVELELDEESNIDSVQELFNNLIATGKIIYLSNLRVEVSEQTEEAYAQQSETYKEVVGMYKSMIPAAQQYGISLKEPVGDQAGLWDSGYNRNLPYAGFAVGLGAEE